MGFGHRGGSCGVGDPLQLGSPLDRHGGEERPDQRCRERLRCCEDRTHRDRQLNCWPDEVLKDAPTGKRRIQELAFEDGRDRNLSSEVG